MRKIIRSCRDGFKVHLNPRERINHPREWIISPHNYRPGYRREVSLRHWFLCTPSPFKWRDAAPGLPFFYSLTQISSYWLYKSVFCVQEWIIWRRLPVLTWDGTEHVRIVKPARTQSDFIYLMNDWNSIDLTSRTYRLLVWKIEVSKNFKCIKYNTKINQRKWRLKTCNRKGWEHPKIRHVCLFHSCVMFMWGLNILWGGEIPRTDKVLTLFFWAFLKTPSSVIFFTCLGDSLCFHSFV